MLLHVGHTVAGAQHMHVRMYDGDVAGSPRIRLRCTSQHRIVLKRRDVSPAGLKRHLESTACTRCYRTEALPIVGDSWSDIDAE